MAQAQRKPDGDGERRTPPKLSQSAAAKLILPFANLIGKHGIESLIITSGREKLTLDKAAAARIRKAAKA